jgi:hypothetical protein
MRIRLALLLLVFATPSQAGVIHVSDFAELTAAIGTANQAVGSTIYLAPGIYSGGALPLVTASTIFQLDPAFHAAAGAAILNTTPTNSKGLLTVPGFSSGVDLTVDGLTFENASISAALGGNGAGIRYQGSGAASLTILNSIFLNNQEGILAGTGGPAPQEQLAVSIVNSLFANNGAPNGFEHGIYIFAHSLNVGGSTFCGTVGGHDIKSRAANTTVSNSFLYDGAAPASQPLCSAGSTSYAIDAPNGGQLTITNDTLVQGSNSPNVGMVSYGEEGMLFAANSLLASGDAFDSTVNGRGIQELSRGRPACLVPVQLVNTSFSANLVPVTPPGCLATSTPVPLDEPENLTNLMAPLLVMTFLFARRRARAQVR